MARRNSKRMVFMVSGATLFALALIAGAALFTLPKITAKTSTPAAQNAMQAPARTVKEPAKTDQPAKVASQPVVPATGQKPAAPATGQNTQGAAPAPPVGNDQPKSTDKSSSPGDKQATDPKMPATPSSVFKLPLKEYGPSIQRMVALGLNTSNKQLAVQLQGGMHLKDIAQVQGVSQSQLGTLLANSIKSGFGPANQMGQLTQDQVMIFAQQCWSQH